MARPRIDASTKKKRTVGITLAPDAMQYLVEQATDAQLSISAYVERFVLMKEWERRQKASEPAAE